jgi:phosphate transport system substrate-binding protein
VQASFLNVDEVSTLVGTALLAAPFVDRLLVRRKRISYRVLYNSKIALGPEVPHDRTDHVEGLSVAARPGDAAAQPDERGGHPDPQQRQLRHRARGLRGAAVVRLRRPGVVEREGVRGEHAAGPQAASGQHAVLSLQPKPDQTTAHIAAWPPAAGQARVRAARARSRQHEVTKEVRTSGKLNEAGLIENESRRRLVTLPRITVALASLLTLLLMLSFVVKPDQTDPTFACQAGDLRIVGSSVFMPVIEEAAKEYMDECGPGTRIEPRSTGSLEGVPDVAKSDLQDPPEILALSDGANKKHHNELYSQRIAIVVYHVVVHRSVGLTTLSTGDLRKIYNGTVTDWSEIRGGDPLPIRIIGRGHDSGTRLLFEEVLGAGEGELSSNECYERDRNNPQAKTIRCERKDNPDIVAGLASVPGAIGYVDDPSIAHKNRPNGLVALTLGDSGFRPCTTPQGPLELCSHR